MSVQIRPSTLAPIMELLKTRTKSLHEQVESSVDLRSHLGSLEAYRSLLKKFYGLYVPLEARLVELFQDDGCTFLGRERLKTDRLRTDLLSLGDSPATLESMPLCEDLPRLSTLGNGWGTLYVMEGATLGGQIIQREAARALGLSSDHGCAFFSGYGARTPMMWRQFGEAVTKFTVEQPDVEDQIVDGAVSTFQTFQRWLA